MPVRSLTLRSRSVLGEARSEVLISRFDTWCFVFFLLGAVGVPAPAAGQLPARVGGGLALGVTPNLAEAFSHDQLCPKRSGVSVSARMTVALTQLIQLEALAEEFRGPRRDCVSAPAPPIPPSGPYTRAFDFYDGRITDPPTVLSLRVGGSFPQSRALTLRPYVGIARLPGKGITIPQAGLSMLGGGSQPRLLFEIEGWWHSVPKQHLEEEYFDGQLVRRSVTEQGVRTFTTIFRVGFTSNVGRS
jgi:hypothetical protein